MTEPFLRFEILEKLGHGGMGIVYRVRDTERKAEVALKTLHEFDPNYLQNFKQEFRIAANIVHPNLVTLYELFCDQAKWFFTMELIRGSSFSSFTGVEISEDDEPLNEPIADGLETRLFALRKVFPQVVTGIGRLHQDGIIHRDLKPNNVLVTDTGRVVILDFGIAVTKLTKPSPHSLEKKITGTIDYMPPEAITGAEPQPQSDWYSLGVMLYQCLTGRLPYAGDTARILYEKVSKDPIAPHEFLPGIPEAWSSLCLTLLKRDPNERPDYRSLLAMIAANPELGFAPDSLSFEEPANLFIGRQSEIDLLTAKLNEVKSGSPAALLVGGKSGVGKSTLIERFLDSVASSEGACVLTGRCYQQEMVPFKALDSLVDSVARYLAHTTDTRLVPQDVQALVSAFPVLRKVEIFYDAVCLQSEVTDRQEINRRAATALAELIGKLAAKQIVALYIDNLQWGDTESAELLYRLLRSIEGARVLFIGSYRQEDEGAAPLFKKLDELIEQRGAIAYLERHTIGALSFEQSVDLALQLLGDTGPDAHRDAELAAKESNGNPFFLRELVRYILNEHKTGAVQKTERTLDLLEVLWLRINHLQEEAFRLLSVIAVAGRPVSEGIGAEAARLGEDGPLTLSTLRAENLLRTIGQGETTELETYHDKVRETILSHLSRAESAALHAQLASTFEHLSTVDLFAAKKHANDLIAGTKKIGQGEIPPLDTRHIHEIAYHYLCAGEKQRALPWALMAADHALSLGSLGAARQQLEIARECSADADQATQYFTAQQLGEVLILSADYHEAEKQLRLARLWAHTSLERARAEAKLGDCVFHRGEIAEALEFAVTSLRMLGENMPSNSLALGCRILQEATVQSAHTILPSAFLGKAAKEARELDMLKVQTLSFAAQAFWFSKISCSLWAHLRAMNLAETHSPSTDLSAVYAHHSAALSALVNNDQRPIRYGERACKIANQTKSLIAEANALTFTSIMYLRYSHFHKAIACAEKAVEIIRRIGDPWNMHSAMFQLAYAHYCLGRLEEAEGVAAELYRSAVRAKDEMASRYALDVWSKAAQGNIPHEHITAHLHAPTSDVQATNELYQALGLRMLFEKNYAEAVKALHLAVDEPRQKNYVNQFTAPACAWHLVALRRCAEELKGNDDLAFCAALAQAKSEIAYAKRITRRFRNSLAQFQREAGLIALLDGQKQKAERLLKRSIDTAAKMGMPLELELSNFEHARCFTSKHGMPAPRLIG